MRPTCPDTEQLDQFIGDRSSVSVPLRDHVSSCVACRARLVELSENRALFAELGSAGSELGPLFGPPAPPPRQIGEFDILREIGRGGMGVVYEAEQRHPARRVALKVVRGDHAASPERRRLFEREIRALARLRHPGIASIFDSGTSDDEPFYAMEFVQGASLIEHARRHNLDLCRRLALFLKLCSAINYAHQRGVIHRDLKPGNVLVEDDGTLKVLDFGLARITDADVSAASLDMDGGRLAGTVAYMSPEQTRGISDEIDLRSDVYSLGVILFELLTDTLPYEVSRTSVVAAIRSICESPPRRPSSIGGKSGRLLAGDIDTIVLKAIEKTPDRRYQSVAALADDVERYLTNQPIVARPPGTIYLLKKFAQRNRVLVGAAVAVFIALGLGIVTTTFQARRARTAEKQARAEAATSAEISRFLTTMFAAVAPEADGNDVRVVDMLKRAAADIEDSFADQPDVAIALREAIGNAYRELTLYAEAEPQFRAGLELARTVHGKESREALRFRYLLAESDAHLDRADEALPELRAILAAQARLFGPDDPDAMTTRHFLGVLATELGHMGEAESLLRDNLNTRKRALGPNHQGTLDSMADLAALLQRLGKDEQSAALLQNAYEIARRTRGPDNAQTLVLQARVAALATTPAELAEVESTYREIVERGGRVFGPDHQQTLGWMMGLARLLERRCKSIEAEEVARDLYERLTRRRGPSHPDTIGALKMLARLARTNGQWQKAEDLARRLLDVHHELYGETDARTLGTMHDLANVLRDSGRLPEAVQLSTQTLKLMERSGSDAKSAAITRTLLAEILRRLDRVDEGRAAAEAAVDVLRSVCPTGSVYIAWAECHLGTCLRDQHHFAEAEPLLLRSHRSFQATLGDCHPQTRDADARIVDLYRMWNEADPGASHRRRPADDSNGMG